MTSLTLLSYNVNGTSPTKIQAFLHWHHLFRQHSVVALQETRSILADPLHRFLSQSHRPYVCCGPSSQGTAGHGLAVYVQNDIHVRYQVKLRKLSPYVIWLQFSTAVGRLILGTVYVPQNSTAMHEVYDTLLSEIGAFQASGAQVLCIGDFNAHVGDLDDRGLDPSGRPIGLACRRGPDSHAMNSSGQCLINLCLTTGTLLCTGRGAGGGVAVPIVPSFTARGAQTRPDHCLVSAGLLPRVLNPVVLSHVHGSDHLPMSMGLAMSSLESVGSPSAFGQTEPMVRLVWDEAKRMDFYSALETDPAVIALLADAQTATLSSETLDQSVQLLGQALFQAAKVVGMKIRAVSSSCRRKKVHQPWFDDECKAAVRALRGVAVTAEQTKQLRSLYQRKKRQHAGQQYSRFEQLCRSQPTYFRKALRRGIAQSSPVVPTADEFAQHFSSVFSGPPVRPPLPSLAPPTTEDLDDLFGDDELQSAFKRLKRRASPGKTGLPVPALAAYPVRYLIQSILRAVHLAGKEPAEMSLALLNPIYKRGDHSQEVNYRPIVVSSLLHKLYANCLGSGVYVAHTQYSHQHGDMFPRQAGFLPDRSTLHNMFVVQHLAHHALTTNRLMYVVFLDVSAAYDTTDHGKLVETLLQLEFPEHLVRGIAGMYQGLRYQVVTNGVVAEPFHVGIGVKQGCPLSPMLYNLYVQPLSGALSALDKGPCFPGLPGCHPDYHYADDAALMAEYLPDLQALLTHTNVVLAARNLKLSVPKCIGLVLGLQAGAPVGECSLSLGSAPLALASPTEGTRYLGLIYDTAASAGTMAAHRASCFSSSFHAATAQMRAAPDFPCALPAFLKLLHTVMEPAGLYGCELWGLLSIPGLWSSGWTLAKFYSLTDPLEVKRCRLVRQWLQLPQSVPLLPLLHELGSEPLVHCYVRRAVRFYNCLVELDVASVYRSALQQNIDDALSTRSRAHNFVGALFQVLRILLPREGGLTRTLRACLPLDIDGIDEALHTRYTEHIQRLSQVVNGPGSRTGLYFRVVGTHVLGVVPSVYSCRLSHGVLVRFLRFRLGCHHLRIHTGRWLPPLLPHSQRTCLRCSSTVVDDEAHCLFMCEHPTIVEARDLFLAAVVPPVAALSSLRYADFWALSATGCVPLSALVKYVAVCVRVCWYCHQSGGTDVVDLPDILLPAGQYLDLFASESETDVPSDSSDEELVEV